MSEEPKINVSELWTRTLEEIGKKIGPSALEMWFRPIRIVSLSSTTPLKLELPNNFFKEWVLQHYSGLIKETLKRILGKDVEIDFTISAAPLVVETDSAKADKPHLSLELNPKYTFESFVVGPSNRFAHAASLAVAESPAKAYNPLFIYGGVGLGKTHLMQAIGHYLLQKNQNIKVKYVSSEKFTNELISSIQNRTMLKFRQKYRDVDVLLIDDIQFIAGKESTQEEFFHTFNDLYDAHKQIVISSDRSPKEIPTLEERLVSRFEWGLVTDIQPPDFETRIAILKKKTEREMVRVPDEVIFFVAEKIKTNIRELEGAMIRVVAHATLEGVDINLELTQRILKDMFLEEEKKVTVDLIQKKVAEYFDIRLSDMKTKGRTRAVAFPRQIAMYLARELTTHSLPEIGEFFGGRDHTTVLHAYNKINKELTKGDSNLKEIINKITLGIKSR
jgi:chromosomal replication initiator protein